MCTKLCKKFTLKGDYRCPCVYQSEILVGNSFIVRCFVSFGEHALSGKKADVHYMHTFFSMYLSCLSESGKLFSFGCGSEGQLGHGDCEVKKSFCLIHCIRY